ncbi:MAG: SufS family cysteine desulfurase [Lentimicrobiaceae bacterium]|jgi:cysteine desulfurase/selenocysteine lyase|nr:SufS family cysteine desulfurase [Lentimicrobiaceae bacterium]
MKNTFDIQHIRNQFPILKREIYGKPLVYLDNAATTQKPLSVIERLSAYYTNENCNIHRGVHYLSQQATAAFENARKTVADFIHAQHTHEIIFTRGTTESINLLATSLGELLVGKGDKVLITAMEHHSNLVPWQQLVQKSGGQLLVVNMDEKGVLDLNHYAELLLKQPKIVSLAHVSNTLGTINPIKEMITMAHQYNIPVVIDGAQSIAHLPIDVQDLDCDFFAFSGHKMYAPMGIGCLYGKTEWLEKMQPYQFGGEMVDMVSFEQTTFNKLPFKFEAGTPNVGAVLALETAIHFLQSYDFEQMMQYEDLLLHTCIEKLRNIDGVRFIGNAQQRLGLVSFLVDQIHPYDLGTIIDKMGIAVRTGHHCAETVMTCFRIPGTVRASFAVYNTLEEIDTFILSVEKAVAMLR